MSSETGVYSTVLQRQDWQASYESGLGLGAAGMEVISLRSVKCRLSHGPCLMHCSCRELSVD